VTGHAASDIRSRCPACQRFATEGLPHNCPNGRNRDEFQNPEMEGSATSLAASKKRDKAG
jgi:hypothetical protein